MKIKFKSENRGQGVGRVLDELWNNWQDLDSGSFLENENKIVLVSKSGNKYSAEKQGDLLGARIHNKFLANDLKMFEIYEGKNPSEGYFLLYRFRDSSRRNEYIIASIMGFVLGSSINFLTE
jgi:hypothetical protein